MSTEYPGLSTKQIQILQFIEEFVRENDGLPPTVREIQAGCQVPSTSTIDYNLGVLVSKGYIRKGEGQSRAL